MGDIREFWLAITIYVLCMFSIGMAIGMTPWLKPSPVVRIVAIFGGGIALGTGIILAWAGVVDLCNKRKR